MDENNTNKTDNGKKMNPIIIGVIVLAVIIVIAGIFLTRSGGETTEQNTNTELMGEIDRSQTNPPTQKTSMESEGTDSAMMEDDSMMEESEVKVVEVEGGSYYFEPNEIRVNEGDTVRVVFNSVDMMHDFVIDEFDAASEIAQAGETVEVTFTANKAGEYEYYCSVGNHRAQGMVGTLIVE